MALPLALGLLGLGFGGSYLGGKINDWQSADDAAKLKELAGHKYQMDENEMFPGEQPIPGLKGKGLLGGEITPEQFYTGLLDIPRYQEAGVKGLMNMMTPEKGESPFGKVDPNKFTPESLQKFAQTGNWADLKAPTGGAFEGTGMDAQAYNTIILYNQKRAQGIPATPEEDMAYKLAYNKISTPQRYTTPDGRMYEIPGQDLGGFVPPQFGRQQPSAPQVAPQGPAQEPPLLMPQPPSQPRGARELGRRDFPDTQAAPAGFASRMALAEQNFGGLTSEGLNPADTIQAAASNVPLLGNYLTSPKYQQYMQAAKEWIRAKLRKESGAVIGEQEFKDEFNTYFPQPGDGPEVIEQKRIARIQAMNALVQQSQGAFGAMFPEQAKWFSGAQRAGSGQAQGGKKRLRYNSETGQLEPQ